MGIFVDTIIPAIRQQSPSAEESEQLDLLDRDMKSLIFLYNEHRNTHQSTVAIFNEGAEEPFRYQLRKFRQALGVVLSSTQESVSNDEARGSESNEKDRTHDKKAMMELQRMLVGQSNSHLDVPNDPVNNLTRLIELERVITDLNKFAKGDTLS